MILSKCLITKRMPIFNTISRFIKGRKAHNMTTPDKIMLGQGGIVEINGKPVAMYKDEQGKTITLSAKCRHLGCIVNWNSGEKTWDCPCHGSRYSAQGQVIKGPTKKDLVKIE